MVELSPVCDGTRGPQGYALLEDDIRICVLDTYRLRGVTIYPAQALLKAYNLPSEGKLIYRYFDHEFLLHGRLINTGCYEVASLASLESAGLYGAFPGLYCATKDLVNRVSEVRYQYNGFYQPLSKSEVQTMRNLAGCFASQFALPVTVALLAFRRLMPDEQSVIERFWIVLGDLTIPVDYLRHYESPIDQDADERAATISNDEMLPEVRRARRLMGYITMRVYPKGRPEDLD